MFPSLEVVKSKIGILRDDVIKAETDARVLRENLLEYELHINETEKSIYKLSQIELHLHEIYRLADLHFPRLQGNKEGSLTDKDIEELEKWVGRVETPEGLKSIVEALEELNKYYPKDIKTNLYGLVQTIIMRGAYGTGKKSKRKL